MTVGFVNAGLMNLSQAIGVIMGANIGTTITAQLVAFNLTDGAPLIVGLKVAFYYGSKKKRVKEIAEIFIGFGILFLGMAYAVFEKEKAINNMEKKFRKNHIDRLNDGLCTTSTGIVFLDTLSNLERIGDHATNMAESIVEVINKGKVMTEVQGDH
jgi:Na+/phosphate symporter